MKRKCIFCRHIDHLFFCKLKQKKVSPNGNCRDHKYDNVLRGCCKLKI